VKKSSAALVLWALLIVSIQAASGQTDTIILLDLPESEYTLKVYRVSDGRWTDIAGRAFSGGRIHRPILQRDSGNRIYVSFLDPEGLSVMRFDGRTWSLVGGSKIPTSTVYYDFKIDRTDRPVVVFEEKDLSGRLTGMAFEGGRWSILGRRGFTDGPNAKEMHLAFDGRNRAHVLHGTFDFGANRLRMGMSAATLVAADPDGLYVGLLFFR